MKKYILIQLGLTIIIVFFLFSCTIPKTYITAAATTEYVSIIDTASLTTAKIENSTDTINTENLSKKTEFINRVNEFSQFILDFQNATQRITKDIVDLDKKRVEAYQAKDSEKVKSYIQEEIKKIDVVINNLSNIYVPTIAKDFYNYELDYYTKWKQWNEYLLSISNNWFVPGATIDNSLRDEAYAIDKKANKELEQTGKEFNQEAGELGLPEPFPYY